MKQILIISPHFPPINAADMHRVRQSVNYFPEFGWYPEVVAVDPKYIEQAPDKLLLQTIPEDLEIHYVKAFKTIITRKLGLGALALRSLFFYFFVVNRLLKERKTDLIFFSTTQFPVLILGRYWKWRFGIPYVIDMQDPWHSDYYLNKPKSQRPPKYWFSYYLNKFLEPIAMKKVSGIMAVSPGYCEMLQQRYTNITPENCVVIPFGAFDKDFSIKPATAAFQLLSNTDSQYNIVYVGRGGADMHASLRIIFHALHQGLKLYPALFTKVHLHFIGTSYAQAGKGKKTIEPLALQMNVADYVTEIPDRVPYFDTLQLLQTADVLLIPGSDDPNYTASKIYPYIMAKKPLLAVFSRTSSVIQVLAQTKAGDYITFEKSSDHDLLLSSQLMEKWRLVLERLPFTPDTVWEAFKPYTAREMVRNQCIFFEKILS